MSHAPAVDDVELIGDEELGAGGGAVANPRSVVSAAQHEAL